MRACVNDYVYGVRKCMHACMHVWMYVIYVLFFSFCWIIVSFRYAGASAYFKKLSEEINDPSANVDVIITDKLKGMCGWVFLYFTNTLIHTLTLTHTLPLTHTRTHTLSLLHTLSLTHTHTHNTYTPDFHIFPSRRADRANVDVYARGSPGVSRSRAAVWGLGRHHLCGHHNQNRRRVANTRLSTIYILCVCVYGLLSL